VLQWYDRARLPNKMMVHGMKAHRGDGPVGWRKSAEANHWKVIALTKAFSVSRRPSCKFHSHRHGKAFRTDGTHIQEVCFGAQNKLVSYGATIVWLLTFRRRSRKIPSPVSTSHSIPPSSRRHTSCSLKMDKADMLMGPRGMNAASLDVHMPAVAVSMGNCS
jgi:hypothetical protein